MCKQPMWKWSNVRGRTEQIPMRMFAWIHRIIMWKKLESCWSFIVVNLKLKEIEISEENTKPLLEKFNETKTVSIEIWKSVLLPLIDFCYTKTGNNDSIKLKKNYFNLMCLFGKSLFYKRPLKCRSPNFSFNPKHNRYIQLQLVSI